MGFGRELRRLEALRVATHMRFVRQLMALMARPLLLMLNLCERVHVRVCETLKMNPSMYAHTHEYACVRMAREIWRVLERGSTAIVQDRE